MERILKELEQVILEKQRGSDSYTWRLLTEGTLVERKVSEEAYELIEAAFQGARERVVYEGADLVFHLLVLLRKYGISLEEIGQELARRRRP